MKRSLLLSILFFFSGMMTLTGCAVTSEEYRYKQRFERYFNLLNSEERILFRERQMKYLGELVDKRSQADEKLKKEMNEIRIYEAITSFNGEQTGEFFYDIILRELNRPNYYRFMEFFDEKGQKAFLTSGKANEEFYRLVKDKYEKERMFRVFMDKMRKDYGLHDFLNEQVVDFFRVISFAEVSRKQVYPLCELLKKAECYPDFVRGDLTGTEQKWQAQLQGKNKVALQSRMGELKRLSGLTKLNDVSFLEAYRNVVMKEMDQGALAKTLEKF